MTELVKLGSGGAATVYLGREIGALGHARLVALKRPHPHLLEDPRLEAALRREAAYASQIRHPNVVDVTDVRVDSGALTLVMEYVDGLTLSDLVRDWIRTDRPDTRRLAVRILLDVADGLHAVHELRDGAGASLGLVHRDVSPQNVLVARTGHAKITDFGLARSVETGDRSTTEGVLKGKVGYLAPEYVKGASFDRRLDVFALGVVAWEILARRRLFRGTNDADSLVKLLSMPIPPLVADDGSTAVDLVVARALERDPAQRFPTARAFADALFDAARAWGGPASHAEVAASMSPELLATLDGRLADLTAAPQVASRAPAAAPPPARWRRLPLVLGGALVLAVLASGALYAARARREARSIAREAAAAPIEIFPESSASPAFTTEPLGSSAPSGARPRAARPVLASPPASVPARPPPSTATGAASHGPRPNPYR